VLKFVLPYPPSVNRLWRASKGGGVYRSPKYAEWRTRAMWQVSAQAKRQKIDGPYKITVLAVKPDKRQRDLDNILKAISDALVSAGVLESDHHCQWIEARWVKEGPECLVTIEPLDYD